MIHQLSRLSKSYEINKEKSVAFELNLKSSSAYTELDKVKGFNDLDDFITTLGKKEYAPFYSEDLEDLMQRHGIAFTNYYNRMDKMYFYLVFNCMADVPQKVSLAFSSRSKTYDYVFIDVHIHEEDVIKVGGKFGVDFDLFALQETPLNEVQLNTNKVLIDLNQEHEMSYKYCISEVTREVGGIV